MDLTAVRRQRIDEATADHYLIAAMALLPIIKLPDPLLRQRSAEIETVDDDVRRLIADMLETMYDAPGVGLAAIQVGIPRRLLVVDTSDKDDEPRPMALINPQIVSSGDELHVHEEGCLSIPDVRVEIERPSEVTVRFIDRDGKQQQIDAEGLLATALQHEIDHLNGRLIIDYLSRLKRDVIVRRFKKMARSDAEA